MVNKSMVIAVLSTTITTATTTTTTTPITIAASTTMTTTTTITTTTTLNIKVGEQSNCMNKIIYIYNLYSVNNKSNIVSALEFEPKTSYKR